MEFCRRIIYGTMYILCMINWYNIQTEYLYIIFIFINRETRNKEKRK